jgi:hypothetical protein
VPVPRLDDAIETAVGLADEATGDGPGSGPAGAGILITGSTTTAGEARTLLGATGTVDAGPAGLAGTTGRAAIIGEIGAAGTADEVAE